MSKDCFVSYARRDRAFVRRLADALQERGRTSWTDWQDIPPSSHWFDEILRGIEDAQAFMFVVSAASLESRVCALELSHAILHNKRLVVPVAEKPGSIEVPAALAAVQWVSFDAASSFDAAVDMVIAALDVDLPWVREHTRLLRLALDWENRGESAEALLRGGQLIEAERWLAQSGSKAPAPSDVHRHFVAAGRRAEDLATAMESIMAADALVVQGRATAVDDAYERAISVLRHYAEEPVPAVVGLWRLHLALPPIARSLGDSGTRIQALAWHDRGRQLIAIHQDGQVEAWHASSGRRVGGWSATEPITAAAVAQSWVATGDAHGVVRLFELATGSQVGTWPTGRGRVWALSISANERTLVIGGGDGGLEVRALPDGAVRCQLAGHTTPVTALALSADGSLLVSGSMGLRATDDGSALNLAHLDEQDVDHTLRLWSLADGQLAHDFSAWRSAVSGIGFFDEGRSLAATTYNQFTGEGLGLLVWDVASGRRIGGFAEAEHSFFGLSLSADASLALTDEFDSATLWAMPTGRRRRTLRSPSSLSEPQVSPSGGHAVAGDDTGRVQVWKTDDEPLLRTLTISDSAVTAITPSPDGTLFLTAEGLRLDEVFAVGPMIQQLREARVFAVGLWDLATGVHLLQLSAHEKSVGAVAFLSDSEVASGDFAGQVRLWDLATGTAARVLNGHDSQVVSLAASPDGRALAAGYLDGKVNVWQLADDADVMAFDEHEQQVSALAWLPGGREVASGSADGTVRIWDAATGRTRLVVDTGPDGTRSLVITPDGRWLVTGGWDRGIHVFDLRTGAPRRSLYGHAGRVATVALSPGGRFVVSGSEDATVRIWDIERGREQAVLEGHAREVNAVAFAANGGAVVSGSADGTVRIWDFRRAVAIAEARDAPEPVRLALMGEWSAALAHPQADGLPLPARAECELGLRDVEAARRTTGELARAEPCGMRWPMMAKALSYGAVEEALEAAELGDTEFLETLLAELPWLANWGGGGPTLLHKAAAAGDLETVTLLLEHGAGVHLRTSDGWTPLHEAIGGPLEVAQALLAAGANPSVTSFEGYTPLHRAALLGATDHARLLLDHGADLESADGVGYRALHFAAAQGREESVAFLVERGADVTAVDSEGHTAAQLAATHGHARLSARLRKAGQA